jgi:hypothetical protein
MQHKPFYSVRCISRKGCLLNRPLQRISNIHFANSLLRLLSAALLSDVLFRIDLFNIKTLVSQKSCMKREN